MAGSRSFLVSSSARAAETDDGCPCFSVLLLKIVRIASCTFPHWQYCLSSFSLMHTGPIMSTYVNSSFPQFFSQKYDSKLNLKRILWENKIGRNWRILTSVRKCTTVADERKGFLCAISVGRIFTSSYFMFMEMLNYPPCIICLVNNSIISQWVVVVLEKNSVTEGKANYFHFLFPLCILLVSKLALAAGRICGLWRRKKQASNIMTVDAIQVWKCKKKRL